MIKWVKASIQNRLDKCKKCRQLKLGKDNTDIQTLRWNIFTSWHKQEIAEHSIESGRFFLSIIYNACVVTSLSVGGNISSTLTLDLKCNLFSKFENHSVDYIHAWNGKWTFSICTIKTH